MMNVWKELPYFNLPILNYHLVNYKGHTINYISVDL